MALRSYQAIDILGTAQTATAVEASDTFAPDPRGFWEVINASAAAINVTVVVPGSAYGQARPDIVTSVPAGDRRRFGPLVADLADPTTGRITITHSAIATVTGAAIYI